VGKAPAAGSGRDASGQEVGTQNLRTAVHRHCCRYIQAHARTSRDS
jgi:hypothetical protein